MNRKGKSVLLFIGSLLLLYSALYPLLKAQKSFPTIFNEKEIQKLPPEIVFTTVLLGGFRGILVDFLWMRAQKLQEEGKYFELVQLSNWIGTLEPKIPEIWVFNAWNLSYNISVEFPTPEERWNWIYQGIKLLRDRALKYLPDSPKIYKEISWIYFNKISSSINEYHFYYKESWARIMKNAMKNMSLDEIVSNSSYKELMKDEKVKKIVKSFEKDGIDINRDWEKILNDGFDSLPQNLKIYLKTPSFKKLEAYLCSKYLKEELKLDPKEMKRIEKKYLPLDWKASSAHSLYWIEEGRKNSPMRDIDYQRMVYFSLNNLLEWGRIDFRKVGNKEVMIISPDISVGKVLNNYYEKILKNMPENLSIGVKSSHRDFLRKVILLSYTTHNIPSAYKYFKYLKKKYPGEVGKLNFSGYLSKGFLGTIKEGSEPEVYNLIFGLLYQAYWYLAVGEDGHYMGLESLTHKIYNYSITKLPRLKELIPSYRNFKEKVLKKSLSSFSPSISNALRSRLRKSK